MLGELSFVSKIFVFYLKLLLKTAVCCNGNTNAVLILFTNSNYTVYLEVVLQRNNLILHLLFGNLTGVSTPMAFKHRGKVL